MVRKVNNKRLLKPRRYPIFFQGYDTEKKDTEKRERNKKVRPTSVPTGNAEFQSGNVLFYSRVMAFQRDSGSEHKSVEQISLYSDLYFPGYCFHFVEVGWLCA